MRILNKGKYLQYLPQEDGPSPSLLLGVRQRKNDPWYTIENNLVNQIVLGLPREVSQPIVPLKHPEGLMDFQIKDVQKMVALKHCLNANPMGLGKTVEAISMLREVEARNALIITPKIVMHQWQDQLSSWWLGDESRVHIYDPDLCNQPRDDGSIWIINYEKFQNEAVLNKFRKFQWEYLILDEAHRIKNRGSKRTKAVKMIPAAHRHALTGTPILRYVDDLWSILNFLDVSYSGISYWNFVNYFCKVEETPWGRKIAGLTDDPVKVGILNALLDSICVRNNSVEVAHGKIRSTVKLPMTDAMRKVYRDLRDLALDELPEGLTVANGAVLTVRLRQLTSWPGLFIQGEVGPKFEYVLNVCQDNPSEKIVVFSVFEKTVEALASYLYQHKVSAATITGQNKVLENEMNKHSFIHGKTQVLIGTIGAMGQGYDGLQEVSRTMIILDRDWSPEIMEQVEDRLRRMGQQYPVSIQYLEVTGSFDAYVTKVNQHKAEDIRAALEVTG